MMGKTHAKGGQVAALGGYLWLQNSGVMSQVPVPGYVGLHIIYPFAVWASTAPDLDHGKNSTPSHDVVSKAIWYVLHATTNLRKGMRPKGLVYSVLGLFDCKHRSWQTHSYEALITLFFLSLYFGSAQIPLDMNATTAVILRLVFMGISLGWLAHIFLDGITPEGIWLASARLINSVIFHKEVLPSKVKLVPNITFFVTGAPPKGQWNWEKIWSTLLTAVSWVLLLIIVWQWGYPLVPDYSSFS